jgi:hypothetical protein
MCVREISGMKTTAGGSAASANSAECARGSAQICRAHSTTASWKPRQMPRSGILRSRARLIAAIFPSVPRTPKPPGTRIPLNRSQHGVLDLASKDAYPAPTTARHASWYLAGLASSFSVSRSEDSTH